MKKYYIGDEILRSDEESCECKLKYYVVESKEDYINYGIMIEKVGKFNLEKSYVEDITTDKNEIFNMAILCKNNVVTPVHLRDIVEDMI